MALFSFVRRARARRRRRARAAPLLPEPMGRPETLRRANRTLAAMALFGAFGTVALALALTPNVQPSSPPSDAPKASLAVSAVKPPPAPRAEPPPPAPVLAALPQRAAKADRLALPPLAPRPRAVAAADAVPEPGPLRPTVREPITIVMAPRADTAAPAPAPRAENRFRPLPGAETEPKIQPAAGLEPSARIPVGADAEPGAVAGHETIERAIGGEADETLAIAAAGDEEAIDDAVDEAVGIAAEQAAPEAEPEPEPATRSAAVTTDVNMRAKPDNGAAVIVVVPGKSAIEVIGCDYWCEVIYAGKRGWIYKGFVRGANS